MSDQYLKNLLAENGVSATVYAFVSPNTRQTFDKVLGDTDSKEREDLHDMYEDAWTQKQDAMHEDFFNTWKQWVSPVLHISPNDFPHYYPTAGASEPIREAISAYGNKARVKKTTPRIHVFAGEYEGYKHFADTYGIECVAHDRDHWKDSIDQINEGEQFYISQPSAIDGNLWNACDDFIETLHDKKPDADVMFDITYVGCIAKDYTVRTDHSNIRQIFFSLSKPLGVYFHRCGGSFTRENNPGLFGNKWFKGLLPMRLATAIMQNHDVFEFPRLYKPFQETATEIASQKIGAALKPSDVYMIASTQAQENKNDIQHYLTRGAINDNKGVTRVCLTPTIDALVKHKDHATVKPRYYETLDLGGK